MSNQACLGVPTAVIGKVWMPLVSSSYAVDTFWTDAIRRRTCQGCASAWATFFSVVLFLSYWPRSSPKLPKSQFLEKSDPLMEKSQNLAMKGFMQTLTHVFLPTSVENGKAQATKQAGILPLSLGLLEQSCWKCYRITLSSLPNTLPSFVQIRSAFKKIYLKMSPNSLKYRREACKPIDNKKVQISYIKQ